ncbi:MAG: hypothetical protein Q8K75_02625 [Chlamydiales bacterium]|nr:hypothetical protein [Chlamydiales bacterium]
MIQSFRTEIDRTKTAEAATLLEKQLAVPTSTYKQIATEILTMQVSSLSDFKQHGWYAISKTPSALMESEYKIIVLHIMRALTHLVNAGVLFPAYVFPRWALTTTNYLQIREIWGKELPKNWVEQFMAACLAINQKAKTLPTLLKETPRAMFALQITGGLIMGGLGLIALRQLSTKPITPDNPLPLPIIVKASPILGLLAIGALTGIGIKTGACSKPTLPKLPPPKRETDFSRSSYLIPNAEGSVSVQWIEYDHFEPFLLQYGNQAWAITKTSVLQGVIRYGTFCFVNDQGHEVAYLVKSKQYQQIGQNYEEVLDYKIDRLKGIISKLDIRLEELRTEIKKLYLTEPTEKQLQTIMEAKAGIQIEMDKLKELNPNVISEKDQTLDFWNKVQKLTEEMRDNTFTPSTLAEINTSESVQTMSKDIESLSEQILTIQDEIRDEQISKTTLDLGKDIKQKRDATAAKIRKHKRRRMEIQGATQTREKETTALFYANLVLEEYTQKRADLQLRKNDIPYCASLLLRSYQDQLQKRKVDPIDNKAKQLEELHRQLAETENNQKSHHANKKNWEDKRAILEQSYRQIQTKREGIVALLPQANFKPLTRFGM